MTNARLTLFCKALFERAPYLSAFTLGALMALAFAPVYFLPGIIISLWGLMINLDQATTIRHMIQRLYVFGLGFFLAGMHWVGFAFRAADMGWVGVPAAILLASILSFFLIPIAFFITPFKPKTIERRLAFAVGFAVCEWLRGHLFTGLPWNLAGSIWGTGTFYTHDIGLSILQSTAWIGVYGLSFLTILAAILITDSHRFLRNSTCFLFIILSAFGIYRLKHTPTDVHSNITIRLVQPCIEQRLKWVPGKLESNIKRHMNLSVLEAKRPLSAIIWPEAAVPMLLNTSADAQRMLAQIIPSNGILLTGASRKENKNLYTGLSVLNEKGDIIHSYDKTHLVPFGEYVPFKQFLPVEKITPGAIDFTAGKGIETVSPSNIPPFSPLICYEALFPGEVVQSPSATYMSATHLTKRPAEHPAKRPEWLLNLTNDAWYGRSSGPYQHLALTRLRAIEEGLPLIRAANNGISAVIDANGRILYKLGLDDVGFIDFELPKPLKTTFYSHYKEIPYWAMLIIIMGIAIALRRKQDVRKKNIE